MKTKVFLLLLNLGLIASTYSQKPTIELIFTAENNGQYVPLDSVFIKNLTQGGDTTLYAIDTVLVLDYVTSINNNEVIRENSFSVSQNYPNPFNQKTTFDLYLSENEYIIIIVMDVLGHKLTQYENKLNRGIHSFVFYSENTKYYLLNVIGKQTSKTIKMLNTNSNPTFREKCEIVYNGYEDNIIGFKSEKAKNNFLFALGDNLRYIGYAKTVNEINGSDVIEDVPLTNTIYEFEITEGIPCHGIPSITYQNQIYNTVLIGEQCCLKENLNVGTIINGDDEMEDNGVIEKYCYDNDSTNCDTYGGLYQWNEMMQYTTTQGTKGICPEGWHIPTHNEWTTLVDYLGGVSIAGGKMKEVDTIYWNSPNIGATNESGFTGYPGGLRNEYGDFLNMGKTADFWSSSETYIHEAFYRYLINFNTNAVSYSLYKYYANSIRCFQD